MFRLQSGFCLVHCGSSNRVISGIEYYTDREVFGLLKVSIIYRFCVSIICFIVSSNIM